MKKQKPTRRKTNVERLLEKRILFVTGKGGVGKTTLVASLASYAHQHGKRVLVGDVDKDDTAPSMIYELLSGKKVPAPKKPTTIKQNLTYARFAPKIGHAKFIEDHIPFRLLSETAKRSKHLQRFLMAAPAFQDLGSVYALQQLLRLERVDGSHEYDFVVVDMPATGHALAITSMPNIVLDVFRVGPIANSIREAQRLFYDKTQTAAVIVTLPEPLPVSETLELIEGLKRDKLNIGALILNRTPKQPMENEELEQLGHFFEQEQPEILGEWSLQRCQNVLLAKETLAQQQQSSDASFPVYLSFDHHEELQQRQFEKLIEDFQLVE